MNKPLGLLANQLCGLALLTFLVGLASVGQVSATESFPTGKYVAGDFSATFTGGGKFTVGQKEETVVEGVYSVTADRIELTDKQGRYACTEAGPGKYEWKYDGKALKFTILEDLCEGRSEVLTKQAFVKQAK